MKTSSTVIDRYRSGSGCRKGFTLVELLTVVAIIAVLAALTLGGIGSMTERSKFAKCASNLRQLAQATFQYAQDNNNQVPSAVYNADPNAGGGSIWTDRLDPYLPKPKIGNKSTESPYFCPSARRPGDWANSAPDYTCCDRADAGATTGAFVGQAWTPVYPSQVRLGQIQSPARMIMFADSFANSDVRQSAAWGVLMGRLGSATYFGKPTLPTTGLAPRHFYKSNPVSGKFNAVFFDGHVESFDWNDPRLQDSAFRRSLVDTQ
jgi:prepilin-type N-terminal cleavage/methylation domain-containing protein/prepilin-type processing-associated H-X9-DG protein